ncbi:hypothetical protein V2W30_32465 [Streptomyces sp. Q6]|uniref:Uncharacterized protein n=1 Tax=Streptomyces citrinus TaxID=3118173 RepID=A0ACD5AK62_9ACTN
MPGAYDVDPLPAGHARLRRRLAGDRLLLTTDPAALRAAETVVICGPTPVDDHLVPDLRALERAPAPPPSSRPCRSRPSS